MEDQREFEQSIVRHLAGMMSTCSRRFPVAFANPNGLTFLNGITSKT